MTDRFVTLKLTARQWAQIVDALQLDAELRFEESNWAQWATKSEAAELIAGCDESIALANLISAEVHNDE